MSDLTTYLDGLDNLVAGWNMDGASGDEQDVSATNSDLVVSLGGGARQAAAIEVGGTLSIDFDGSTTLCYSTSASPSNIFDGGGSIFVLIHPDTMGESSSPRIWTKTTAAGDMIDLFDESGGFCKVRFRKHWTFSFSLMAAWSTTNRIVQLGKKYAIVLLYNADSVSNDPTIYVHDIAANSTTTCTVGSGLTETSAPWGSGATSDAAVLHYIGASSTSSNTFDGRISVVRLYTDLLTNDEVLQALDYASNTTVVTTLYPDPGTLTLTTYAATWHLRIYPASSSLTLTGYTPTVKIGKLITPGAATLTLTAFTPTITMTGNVILKPQPAVLTLTPVTSTVVTTNYTPPVRTPATGEGRYAPRGSGGGRYG